MTTDKRIARVTKFAKEVLAQKYPAEQCHSIMASIASNYKEIQKDIPVFKSSFNRMLLQISVDSLAFYRALRTELEKDDALKMILPFVNRWMDGQFDNWIARKIYRNRFLHRIYRRWWFARTNKANDPEGQQFEYLKPTGNLFYGVNVLRCGHVHFLKKMNAEELAPYMCKADLYIQKYLPKGIVFKRSQVIAEGAPYCDFRYVIDESGK
ncbi:L-2-amino-thiazoline-4-carboxylic acid hydrolase [Sungkyunkwania multivorans]|uniref:L-2-amino-thiazoline-4-carboxylic acid hydrolase n=1 Tax=Sungkyunkwania multivorans TaxID=1173618 RepID=A0ABW3D0U7_9FLAO